MAHHGRAVHHLHRRRSRSLEPYPHPDKWVRSVDRLVYVTVFLGPIMTLPQLVDIWLSKNAGGVSVISWGTYTLISVVWLVYGWMHKDKPIWISSLLWLFLDGAIVAGALIYG